MTTINQILKEDKQHDSIKCRKITGRRLYIRDFRIGLNLGYPDLKIDNKIIKKQRFRPIGIICLGCAYAILSKDLLYTLKRHNINEDISKINDGKPLRKRQENRRLERQEKKSDKQLEKIGMKYPHFVKIES